MHANCASCHSGIMGTSVRSLRITWFRPFQELIDPSCEVLIKISTLIKRVKILSEALKFSMHSTAVSIFFFKFLYLDE